MLLNLLTASAGPIGGGGQSPPTNVTLSSSTSTTGNYTLSWTNPFGTSFATMYLIEERKDNGSWDQIWAADHPDNSYVISGRNNGTYDYRIKAIAAEVSSYAYSGTIAVTLPNDLPTVEAGANQTKPENSLVSLSGSASDSDGSIVSYLWQKVSGSAITLTNPTSANASFIAPNVSSNEVVRMRLTATDNDGGSASDDVYITVTNQNELPLVNITQPTNGQILSPSSIVTAKASVSDSDGALTRVTFLLDGELFPDCTFTSPIASTPSCNLGLLSPGSHTITVSAEDNDNGSSSDSVSITINNLPIANAGANQSKSENTTVTLNGSGTDSDGTIVSYFWQKISGPSISLANANAASTSFTAPSVSSNTNITMRLTVTDNHGGTDTDDVVITVTNQNVKPDVTITQPTEGQVLSPTSSITAKALVEDVDGSLTQVAFLLNGELHPGCAYSSPSEGTISCNLGLLSSGSHSVTVTAEDNDNATTNKSVNFTVNSLPTANAGANQSKPENTTVNLNGSGTDSDGTIVSYFWQKISGPTISLANANAASTSFTAPSVSSNTNITMRLTVTDNHGGTDTDDVVITVTNQNVKPDVTITQPTEGQVLSPTSSVIAKALVEDVDGSLSQVAYLLDGELFPNCIFTSPSEGTITCNLGLVSPGDHTLTVTAKDNDNASDSDSVNFTINSLPIANAGIDRIIDENKLVSLIGSGTDSDGTIVSYLWEKVTGPTITLIGANSANASFTSPSITSTTDITMRLTVTDNDGGTDSDDVLISVSNLNVNPTVVITHPTEGQALSSSGSVTARANVNDSDGSLTRVIFLLDGEIECVLTSPAEGGLSCNLGALPPGSSHTLQVTAEDNDDGMGSGIVNFTINNPPICIAQPDLQVNENDLAVNLISKCSDADAGDSLDYQWVQTGGSPMVTLTNATTATAEFDAPSVDANTDLTFTVTATDDLGETSSDTIIVHVNNGPTAVASAETPVDEGKVGATLTGSTSHDVGGTIETYHWTQTAGLSAAIANENDANATFTAPSVDQQESLTFRLTVIDDLGLSDHKDVSVTVTQSLIAPDANAGPDSDVNEGTNFSLIGNGTDSDGTITDYLWEEVGTSLVTLIDANTANASFTAPDVDANTPITFKLTVTDNDGLTGSDEVVVTVQDIAGISPVADAGLDQTVDEGVNVALTGSGTDSDGTVTDYLWEEVGTSLVTLIDANTANASFTAPDVDGNTPITFKLTVTDNDGLTGSDEVVITVNDILGIAPVADAGSDQTIEEGISVLLTGIGTDSDGTIADYLWEEIGTSLVTLSDANTADASFTTPDVDADTLLTFKLTVTDNDGLTASDEVVITVQPAGPQKFIDDIPNADLVTLAAPAHDETIDQLNPKISVNGGALNASLPIVIPPGRAGMQPNVSINYSSDSGNGLLGQGWSLSAGSSIRRCANIYHTDSSSRSVMDDAGDKLCLDGARLAVESTYTYGESGAVYHPENNPQVEVVQTGSLVTGSAISFEVNYANGHQSFYGDSDNSKVVRLIGGKETAWKISKKQDQSGSNNITYNYDITPEGYSLLTDIYYTGDASNQGNRRINFEYDSAREDVRVSYRNKGKRLFNSLLKVVRTYAPDENGQDTLARQYQLNYVTESTDSGVIPDGDPDDRILGDDVCKYSPQICEDIVPTDPIQLARVSLLDSITLCADENSNNCLTQTGFNYGEWDEGFNDKVLYESLEIDQTDSISFNGDFDGDGTPDLDLGKINGGPKEILMSTTGLRASVNISTSEPSIPHLEQSKNVIGAVNDFDLDGRSDILGFNNTTLQLATWDGTTFNVNSVIDPDGNGSSLQASCDIPYKAGDRKFYYRNCSIYAADFNGDAKPDILVPYQIDRNNHRDKVYFYVYLNTTTTPGDLTLTRLMDKNKPYTFFMQNDTPAALGDFDGDGTVDLFSSYDLMHSNRLVVFKTLVASDGTVSFEEHDTFGDTAETYSHPIPMDINSDGLMDISHDNINIGGEFLGGDIELEPYGGFDRLGRELKKHHYIKYLDYNQDGLIDMLMPQTIVSESTCVKATGSNRSCLWSDYAQTQIEFDTYQWTLHLAQTSETGEIYFTQNVNFIPIIAPLAGLSIADVDSNGFDDIVVRLGEQYSDDHVDIYNDYNGNPVTSGIYVYFNKSRKIDKLTKISTAFGVEHYFDYASLSSNADFFQRCLTTDVNGDCQEDIDSCNADEFSDACLGSQFPYINFATNHISVKQYSTSNVSGDAVNKTRFKYRKARFHKQGRGFQGFGQIIEEKYADSADSQAYAQVTTDYLQKFPFSGMVEKQTSEVWKDSSWVTNSETSNNSEPTKLTGAFAGTYVAYQPGSSSVSYDLDGSVISTQTSSKSLNTYGQLESKTSTISDGNSEVTKITTETFVYDEAYWYQLGLKITNSEVSYADDLAFPASALKSVAITQDYSYNGDDTRPASVDTTSDDTTLNLLVETEYLGSHGQVSKVSTSSDEIAANDSIENDRSKFITYTSDGYFVASTANSQWGSTKAETTNTYDPAHGQVTVSVDANGIYTYNDYDSFGRLISTSTNGLEPVYSSMQWCIGGCAANDALYKVTTEGAGMPTSEAFFDKLGREIYSRTQVGANYAVASKTFDNRGRVLVVTEPSGGTTRFDSGYGSYDELGRVTQKTVQRLPIHYQVNNSYTGLKQNVTVTPLGVNGGATLNMATQNSILGAPLYHQDDNQNRTEFRYDALGNPALVRDVAGNDIKAVYNGFGHKTSLNDPNMGNWSFSYNALGELRVQTDAKGKTTSYNYDALGRIVTTTPQGETPSEFKFDTNGEWGLLVKENKGTDFVRTYQYDNRFKTPEFVTTSIDNGAKIFTHQTAMDDNYGRVKGELYSSGVLVEHKYNDQGMMIETRDFAADKSLRLVSDFDLMGRITSQIFGETIYENSQYTTAGLLATRCASIVSGDCTGNGEKQGIQNLAYSSHDSFGNLLTAENKYLNQTENFQYDNLHRLVYNNRTWINQFGQFNQEQIDYAYDDVGNLKNKTDFSTTDANAYLYAAGTNQLQSIALKTPTSDNRNSLTYTYDANGNLKTDGIRTITYGVNNKPVTISSNNADLSFSYGSDGLRYKQVKTANSLTTTTYYAGSYEEEVTSVEAKTRTSVGGFALYTTDNEGGKWHFTLTDHLGSMETIVDKNGVIEQKRNYDPFGKSRDNTTDETENAPLFNLHGQLNSDYIPRGFTNHEHLDEVELIHMNGRVYDYNSGRFLSVDPFISMPGSSQAYNPYSYVMNNPLSYTDPTGYVVKKNAPSIVPGSGETCEGGSGSDACKKLFEKKQAECQAAGKKCAGVVVGNGAKTSSVSKNTNQVNNSPADSNFDPSQPEFVPTYTKYHVDENGNAVTYQEGELKTYQKTGQTRVTKSKWEGMKAKQKPLETLRNASESNIILEGIAIIAKKGAAAVNILSEIARVTDELAIDTLYRTVNQESLYEEFSQPAFKEITGKRGYPKVEIQVLENNPVKTGVSKWHRYNSYKESGMFQRYTDPNNMGMTYYGE